MKIKNLKSRLKIIIIAMCILNSCGLRQDSATYENILLDTWKLQEIKCYDPDYSTGDILEIYLIPSNVVVEMKFTPRSFTYAVTESGNTTNCITSADGNYQINFSSAQEGNITFKGLNLSPGCDIDLNESGSGNPFAVPFGFSGLSEDVNKLYWTQDTNGYLLLQVSTEFYGSYDDSLCGDYCYCYGSFAKNSN